MSTTSLSPRNPGSPLAVGDHQFLVEGRVTGIFAAAVHYWRLRREDWGAVLDSVVALGCTAVSIYVPWEAHETARGAFDFGSTNPSLDLDAFLEMLEERDLDIVVRPGPQINGEMTWFGYPKRLLADRSLHALTAAGASAVLTQVPKPIPALSYADDRFFEETALWLDAVCEVLARHAHPRGRIIAAQVDNEMAYFFNVNAWAADYSDASVAGYRRFLAQRYEDIAELNDVYGSDAASFEAVEPPRRYEAAGVRDIPRLADWSAYREHYLITCLSRLADMYRERGLGDIPLFHNYPHPLNPGSAASGFTTPFHLHALEGPLDFVGFDMYSSKRLYQHVKTVVSYVAGTSRFPYAPELISGSWPWYQKPGDATDEEFVIKAALMHGLKGFSRYVLVERDRWLGSAIRADGSQFAPGAELAQRVNALAGDVRLKDLRRQADVLLLADRDYDRHAASSVLVGFPGDFLETATGFSEYPNELTVSEDPLGLAEPVQLVKEQRFTSTFAALTATGYPFLLSDTGADHARWAEYQVVVLNSYEYLNAAVQRSVLEHARAGATVVIGPQMPDRDERLQTDTTLADALIDGTPLGSGTAYPVGAGRVVLLSEVPTSEALTAVLRTTSARRVELSDARLDAAVHVDATDPTRLVVFVANPTDAAIDCTVRLPDAATAVTEVWEDRAPALTDGAWSDHWEPYTIAVYSVTTSEKD